MGIDDSGEVTALVGLDGFVVRALRFMTVSSGGWQIETTADGGWVVRRAACRAVGHGRRRVKVRDLPIAGEPVTVVWAKRIWRCREADCSVPRRGRRTPTEIAPRAVLTERARAEIARRVGPG